MKSYSHASAVRVYTTIVITLVFLLDVIQYCASASVKSAREFRPDVYIVTPSSSEARDFPYFIPTPLPEEKLQKPERYGPSKYASPTRSPPPPDHPTFPPFQPTPLPVSYTRPPTSDYVLRSSATTKGPPDIIIAEFREGKPNERMLSVKEMLSKEKVTGYSVTTSASTSTTYSRVRGKNNAMDVQDVWDIIKHNQDLEVSTPKRAVEVEAVETVEPVEAVETVEAVDAVESEAVETVDAVNSLPAPTRSRIPEYTVETVPSLATSKDAWSSAEPGWKQLNKTVESTGETTDEPRAVRGGPVYPKLARERYYPAYSGQSAGYSNVDSDRYDLRPATGEAEDRYNPAQPYLPPHTPRPEQKRPAAPASLPAPPVPMPPPPPPPPPQPYMNAPSVTYDSIPSYSPPDSSPQKPDTSGPPSDSYSYPSPDDAGPPPASFTSPSDDHHHDHHHDHDHHDDGFKFEPPPSDSPGDHDSYPQLIFEDDHHSHHSSHEIDYHDLHEFYHHHHHHHPSPPPPPPPPPPATTTPAPEMEDTRVNNRFSYYYLGKKLWYLPLYFSVYFIIYVGALIIKSVARHKITYPQHYKTKRSLDWKMSEKDLHTLTRFTCNALLNAAERYSGKSRLT